MIFDTHSHYDDDFFDADRDELLTSLKDAGVGYVVDVGASMESNLRALDLAEKYDFVYAAVGVHPTDTAPLNEEFIQFMKRQALTNPKVVAIGEMGLDYYWDNPARDIQKKWFIRQLDLAKEVKKPIIIHSREACEDTKEILLSSEYRDIPAVMHCYSYSPEIAREYLNAGYYLGVGGVLTYKNAKKLVDTVEMMPLSRIVLETDCPYLTPVPNRGKRNDSRNLKYVVEKIAEIKGISQEQVIEATRENAFKLYNLDK